MVLGVNQSKEDISDCKGLRDIAMATKFWPKKAKNFTKVTITSIVCDNAEFGFEIGFQLSASSPRDPSNHQTLLA